MFDDFYYTFKIESLPFDDLEDEIIDYFSFHGYCGFCYKNDNCILRVVTIGMTRRKVDEMKNHFNGYHVKQIYDVDILIDCLNPNYRFYGILKNKEGRKFYDSDYGSSIRGDDSC